MGMTKRYEVQMQAIEKLREGVLSLVEELVPAKTVYLNNSLPFTDHVKYVHPCGVLSYSSRASVNSLHFYSIDELPIESLLVLRCLLLAEAERDPNNFKPVKERVSHLVIDPEILRTLSIG